VLHDDILIIGGAIDAKDVIEVEGENM